MRKPGNFEVEIRIPGEKLKRRAFQSNQTMVEALVSLPPGTKIWVKVTHWNLGYGMEVKEGGYLY